MYREETARAYAKLIIRTGVNLQKGQLAILNAPIENAEFARMVLEEAYRAGARDVLLTIRPAGFAISMPMRMRSPMFRHGNIRQLKSMPRPAQRISVSNPTIPMLFLALIPSAWARA